MPLVSVVIPSYNSAKYLPETIESILSQTFKDLEIIVVDDGSVDNTEKVVNVINSSKITYIKQDNSGGPSKPRNVGIERARGKYIALFDSDDIMLPTKLSDTLAFLEHQPHLGIVFTNFVLCDEQGNQSPGTFLDAYSGFCSLRKEQKDKQQFVIESRVAHDGLISENFIGTSGVVIPKRVLLSSGQFDESLSIAEDWDMWLRISRRYDIGYLDEIGHRYRRRGTGLMSRGAKVIAPQQVRFMRKQLEQGLSSAATRKAHRFIAEALFGLGYDYQCNGALKQARQNYKLSLQEAFSWSALKGLLVSYLGARAVAYIRDLKTKAKVHTNGTPTASH
ncbi:MAG: glycosyltransferase family 2 protein [Nitrospiraceae bacterium]